MEKLLKLYKYIDGVNDTPFPNSTLQAQIADFTYSAKRMSHSPTITGTLMYPLCLDKLWGNDIVYVTYNSEKYFLKNTPTSSYSNTDSRYKHELEFVAEREILNNVYFYDVVTDDATVDRPVSNSTNFSFFGNISEFATRLNYSLKYAKVGYTVVVDDGISSESKLVSFKDQFISNALQEVYNTYNIPYYYVGKVIHIGYTNNAITDVFKQGIDGALLSVQKTNANYKVVNRVTGVGSSDNISLYYPNTDPKGVTSVLYNGNTGKASVTDVYSYKKVNLNDKFTYRLAETYKDTLTNGTPCISIYDLNETSANIWELQHIVYPFTVAVGSAGTIEFNISYGGSDLQSIYIKVYGTDNVMLVSKNKTGSFSFGLASGSYEIVIDIAIYSEEDLPKSYQQTIINNIGVLVQQVIEGTRGWYLNNNKATQVDLSDYGISLGEDVTPVNGDSITIRQISYIKPQQELMPPIYRESGGEDRFYNAKNNTYLKPGTTEYYEFENPYVDGKPKEQKVDFTNIKPSIVGMTNNAGQRIDLITEFAYDTNDNDDIDEDGNYIHPYFFAKLRKFNGTYGFNLFKHAIENNDMEISMTNGSCGGCTFTIMVDEDTQRNTVQVDSSGNLLRDSNGNVRFGRALDEQNDTINNEVWIALKKDNNTFGVVMPNATNNYRPKGGDSFVILHINLPQAYILAAENKLKEELIKYMVDNNSEKFTFSISFSRIFFTERPDILALLNENARLLVQYNKEQYSLYVSNYSYVMKSNEALPEIRVDLSDTITISQNALQNAISEVQKDIMANVGNMDWYRAGLRYFLRKDTDDRTKGTISSDKGFEVGKFVTGVSGAVMNIDPTTKQTYAEVDRLKVRLKAYFEQLEIVNVNTIGGKQIISPAGSMTIIEVADSDTSHGSTAMAWNYYRCFFKAEQENEKIENRFAIGDLAFCQRFNAKEGVTNNISNKYYWRAVVGVGSNYIDLSKSDCAANSDAPEVGDVVCQRGNKTDVTRQNFIEISAVGDNAPRIVLYQGINDYNLTETDIISFGFDSTSNKAYLNVYGNLYVGDRNGNTYVKYTPEDGVEIKGRLAVGTKLGNGETIENALLWARDGYKEDFEDFTTTVAGDLESMQQQIDGQIESFFYEYAPTLDNYPANEWTTTEAKEAHLNDTFTNLIDGRSWRWTKTTTGEGDQQTTIYSWTEITDTATTNALFLAGKAKDTADGKRRVFVRQPLDSEEYDIGDLWVNATYGEVYKNDILRAKIAKEKDVAFSIDHWELASKYTDDSKALELFGSLEYVKKALGETTIVDGGLILSSLMALGYTDQTTKNFIIQSGINGIFDTTEKGNGIAAWFGGNMVDKEATTPTPTDYAQTIFRFDGSGYLAGGNITWDKSGAGNVAGGNLSWDAAGNITLNSNIVISGDADETLASVLNYISELQKQWFIPKDNTVSIATGKANVLFGYSTKNNYSGGIYSLATSNESSAYFYAGKKDTDTPTDVGLYISDTGKFSFINGIESGVTLAETVNINGSLGGNLSKIKFSNGATIEVDGNYLKVTSVLYSTKNVAVLGEGEDVPGGGGGASYNRLDTWDGYDNSTMAGYVLSAGLGYDINTRLTTLENSGLTGDYLPSTTKYALSDKVGGDAIALYDWSKTTQTSDNAPFIGGLGYSNMILDETEASYCNYIPVFADDSEPAIQPMYKTNVLKMLGFTVGTDGKPVVGSDITDNLLTLWNNYSLEIQDKWALSAGLGYQLFQASHTHSNKSVLDTITSTMVNKWNGNYLPTTTKYALSDTVGGNALYANRLTYSRKISLSGAVQSNGEYFNGSSDISIPVNYIYSDFIREDDIARNNNVLNPLTKLYLPQLRMNVLEFVKPSSITLQYSRDGGATWIDYFPKTTQAEKDINAAWMTRLVSGLNYNLTSYYTLGKATQYLDSFNQHQLKIDIDTMEMGADLLFLFFIIYIGANGGNSLYVTIDKRHTSSDVWTNVINKLKVIGEPGYNKINLPAGGIRTDPNGIGSSTSNTFRYRYLRIILTQEYANIVQTAGCVIYNLYAMGNVYSGTTTTMKTGMLYDYDEEQNMILPAGIKFSNGCSISVDGDKLKVHGTIYSDSNVAVKTE